MTDAFEYLGIGDLTDVRPLAGGYQSKVLQARSAGHDVVLKLVRADSFPRAQVVERVRMIGELSELTPLVCRPVELEGRVVRDIRDPDLGDVHLVAYEHADGTAPDPVAAEDAEAMGCVLAELHRAMRHLRPFDLPAHRLARIRPSGSDGHRSAGWQLLHGDFGAANVRRTEAGWRVFDLDDCGYGEAEHDVANALYMIMFDAVVGSDRPDAFVAWPAFLSGYQRTADAQLDPGRLRSIVDDRVDLLATWLAEPASAPPGIADAAPAWKDTLARFVASYRAAAYGRFRLDGPT
jgi:Ser/Thr protein kinase RdoA (MazF antagonist)